MLTLFTNITEQLTDHEKNVLVPMLLSTLAATHAGTGLRVSRSAPGSMQVANRYRHPG